MFIMIGYYLSAVGVSISPDQLDEPGRRLARYEHDDDGDHDQSQCALVFAGPRSASARKPRTPATTYVAAVGCLAGGRYGRRHNTPAAATGRSVTDDHAPVHEGQTRQRQSETEGYVEDVGVDVLVCGVLSQLSSIPRKSPVRLVTIYLQLEISAEYNHMHRNRYPSSSLFVERLDNKAQSAPNVIKPSQVKFIIQQRA